MSHSGLTEFVMELLLKFEVELVQELAMELVLKLELELALELELEVPWEQDAGLQKLLEAKYKNLVRKDYVLILSGTKNVCNTSTTCADEDPLEPAALL